MRRVQFLLLALLACPSPTPAETADELPDMYAGLDVVAEAYSLPALVTKAKPDFVWNEKDMLWVKRGRDGHPRFAVCRALVRFNPKPSRWMLVRAGNEEKFPILEGEFPCQDIDIVAEAPQNDGAPPSHALVIGMNQRRGTLYRLRWGSVTGGNAYVSELRDIFLLQSPTGHWTFIGEGASVGFGRDGPDRWCSEDVSYRFNWDVADRDQALAITATFSEMHGSTAVDNSPETKRDLTCLREGTLDPKVRKMRWGEHFYTAAQSGETIDNVVIRIGEWKLGYYYDNHPERRPELLALLRPVVEKLNPRSAATGRLSKGERILVPTYQEIRQALNGSPATRPSTPVKR